MSMIKKGVEKLLLKPVEVTQGISQLCSVWGQLFMLALVLEGIEGGVMWLILD